MLHVTIKPENTRAFLINTVHVVNDGFYGLCVVKNSDGEIIPVPLSNIRMEKPESTPQTLRDINNTLNRRSPYARPLSQNR